MIITLEDKLEILTELMSSSDVTGNRVFTKFNPIWFDNKAAVISTNKNFLESIRHQIAKMDKLLSEEEGSDLDVDLMDKSDEYIPVMAILYEEFMGYLKTLEGEKIIRIVDIPTDEGFKLLPVRLEGNYILELFKEIHPAYEALCTEVAAISGTMKKDSNLIDKLRDSFDKNSQRRVKKINKFPENTKWENITVEFNRDGDVFYVKNSINNEVREFSYKDIKEFVDSRRTGGSPSRLYCFFKDLCKFNSFVPNRSIGIDSDVAFRQTICSINAILNENIPLSESDERPLKSKREFGRKGYTIRFKIKDPDPFKYSCFDKHAAERIMKENNVPFED